MRRPSGGEIPRVLSVPAGYRLGFTASALDHAVAARGWQRLVRGFLLTVPGPPTRTDWINVGLEIAGPTGALSGWDAARIAGLGDARPPSEEILVLSRRGTHRLVGRVRIRPTSRPFASWTLPAEDPDLAYATVVHTARAVADTGLQYRRLAPVRALVTSAVQKRRCTVEELIAEVDAGPRKYSAHLRRAVADLRAGARSIAEAEAIEILRRAPVPAFEANVDIVTVGGLILATVDLLWRELRAVVEIDSREFHFTEAEWAATRRRHNRLTPYGLAIQHYSPAEVRRGKRAWAAEVATWLRARAQELGVPYVPQDPGHRLASPAPFVVPELRPSA